jgi:hypothetical protein
MFISFPHKRLTAREQFVVSRKIDVYSSAGLQVLNSPASEKVIFGILSVCHSVRFYVMCAWMNRSTRASMASRRLGVSY